jgi:hypothetical protein
MPAVRSRRELLAEIDAEHEKLLALVERVPKAEWSASSVNAAGWSLKDVLAHVTDWAQRCAGWCEAGTRGEAPELPAPGFTWKETPKLNHAIFLKRRAHGLARVRRDYTAAHAALIQLVRTMPEADLCTPCRFAWTGKTWSVAQHIRANTAGHDRWAAKHFAEWLRVSEEAKPERSTKKRTVTPRATNAPVRREEV